MWDAHTCRLSDRSRCDTDAHTHHARTPSASPSAPAAQILAQLTRQAGVTAELLRLNGVGLVVGHLQSGDSSLTHSLLKVVCHMAGEATALQEVVQVSDVGEGFGVVIGGFRVSGC